MVASPRREEVGTSPANLVSYNPRRTILVVYNEGPGTVYWGNDPEVNSSNGFPLEPGTTATFSRLFGDDPRLARWFVASTTSYVRIAEESVSDGKGGE